jgi:hypothetical protein
MNAGGPIRSSSTNGSPCKQRRRAAMRCNGPSVYARTPSSISKTRTACARSRRRSRCATRAPSTAPSGDGYRFLASLAETIDPLNPALAARLLTPFESWKRFDAQRQGHAREALEHLASLPQLSKNTREMVERTLA